MEPFREAHKNAGELVLDQGGPSVFGLIGQLMEDIRYRDCTEESKWQAWKDICRKIKKMNAGYNARIEGCKVADLQRVLNTIFAEPDRMNVTQFEEAIRYTEYCRRMALFRTTQNNAKTADNEPRIRKHRDNNNEGASNHYHVSLSHHWSLIYFKLSDTTMTMDERRSYAGQVKNDLIQQGLWEKKNMEDNLKKLKEQIISILG
ncbi:MAG: hypothetical protein K6U80_04420 [Firmicutes bacterium]|nr:hypothetical protein [Bacillota bacterium]